MSKSQRTKGAQGEREAAHLLSEELGQVVERILSQTRDGGHDLEVTSTAGKICIEVKRQERANILAWMDQAEQSAGEHLAAVMWRPSRKGWQVVMSVKDWVKLVREAQ